MKEIEKFINEIYTDVSGKEAEELKYEMHAHLIETVAELKAEGKTEKEAIHIALNRFGDGEQISKGLLSIFQLNNSLIKNLLRISFISLILGLIVLVGLLWREDVLETKKQNIDHATANISKVLASGQLTSLEEEKILSIVEETKEIESFSLYKNPDLSTPTKISEIEKKWNPIMMRGQPESEGSNNFKWINKKDPYEKWYFNISHEKLSDIDKFFAVPFGLFIVFIILSILALLLKNSLNRKMVKAFVG